MIVVLELTQFKKQAFGLKGTILCQAIKVYSYLTRPDVNILDRLLRLIKRHEGCLFVNFIIVVCCDIIQR